EGFVMTKRLKVRDLSYRKFLHSAGTGYYLPFSRLVFVDGRYDHFSRYSPQNLSTASISDLAVRAAWEHELVHHIQTQTTTIGYWMTLLSVLKVQLVEWVCQRLRTAGVSKLRIPLLRAWAFESDSSVRDDLETFAWAYSNLAYLYDVILGDHVDVSTS